MFVRMDVILVVHKNINQYIKMYLSKMADNAFVWSRDTQLSLLSPI